MTDFKLGSRLMVSRRTLVAGTACYAATATIGNLWAADPAGLVDAIKGEAAAEANGARRLLAPQAGVFVDEIVSTGRQARLLLKLGQRTTVRLGGATRLKIERYLVDAGGEFDLLDGAVLFDRIGAPAKTDLKIKSAYGLMAVRGTRFFAGPSNGVFGVFVARGRVDVEAAGRMVSVGAGQGTDIARPGAQPTTPKTWGAARVRRALASVT